MVKNNYVVFNGKQSTSRPMPSPARQLSVTLTFERMTFKIFQVFLTIFGLAVTLTFDLLTSKFKQFIFGTSHKLHLSRKFGDILTSGLYKISCSQTSNILSRTNGHTDSRKTECLQRIIAGEGIQIKY